MLGIIIKALTGEAQLEEEVAYVSVGLSRGQESSALMHASLTRWAAKSFKLHGRRIVTVISRAFSNSNGRGRNERGVRLWVSFIGLKQGRSGNRSEREALTLPSCFGHRGPGKKNK